jgi:type IV secretion system protein VirB1
MFSCLFTMLGAALCCVALCVFPARARAQTVAGVDPEFSALMARCAPTVHPETMAAVVSAESRGHEFAIADAGPVALPWSQRKAMVRSIYPGSVDEAVATARALIANGHTVSLGIAQVNDRSLAKLNVALRDVFDPCTNVRIGGQILTDFYKRAVEKFGPGKTALNAALSAYNSGDWMRGAKDGYVNRVYGQLGKPLAINTQRVVPRVPTAGRPTLVAATAPVRAAEPTREFTMKASNFSLAEMH